MTTKALGPGRIVALVLISLTAAGLAYLRWGTGSDRVAVPAGAHAGQLTLHPCTYATEDGGYAADCGTLVVPETRRKPGSRLIAVPVTRIRARAAHPAEPIFRLEGGPGGTNMEFAKASRYAGDHDVVLVGYRGVDGSEKLDCPEVESAVAHSADLLAAKSQRAYADAFRACAARLTRDGVDVTSYGLVQQVDDLEATRRALGYGRVDLISESAGTRTAMIYAWRYPKSVHRSVMIGVNPPGNFLWHAKTTNEQIGHYAALCAKDESCSKRTDDLAATMRRTEIPGRWLFLPIHKGNVRVASLLGLMESSSAAAPADGPLIIDSWLDGSEGDASGFWLASLLGHVMFPKLFVWGQYAAAGHIDAQAAHEYFSHGPLDTSNIGVAATSYIWGGGRLADAWPAAPDENAYGRVRRSNVETLLIGGNLDFSTPPQIATKELLPYLPNGREVVLPSIGHSTSFFAEQKAAGTRLINTYFDSGRVDTSLYRRQTVDFTPSTTHAKLAKLAVGIMLGLAVLTVLSLLVMSLRARRRPFGRKARATLRSVYAVVLGLGGWFTGLLIVLAAFPTVPIDDELLTALSVGVPVALGIYFAWVDPNWSAATKTTGFAAAATGALLGAWLGFHATPDLAGLVTAIAGAVAGANATVVGLDAAWDGQARDRFAAETLEATTAVG